METTEPREKEIVANDEEEIQDKDLDHGLNDIPPLTLVFQGK